MSKTQEPMPSIRTRQPMANAFLPMLVVAAMLVPPGLFAQCSATSGSTGADLEFNPTNSMPATGWSVSNNVVTVTNKSNGIFNFTTVYIETNWVVRFTRNTLNTPLYLLATSNVTIRGQIDVSGGSVLQGGGGTGGQGGPGGFDGGNAGIGNLPGGDGFGPGGGRRGDEGHGQGGGFGTPGDAYWAQTYGGGAAYGTVDI